MMSMNIVADLSSNRTPRFGWTSGWPVNRCSLNFFHWKTGQSDVGAWVDVVLASAMFAQFI